MKKFKITKGNRVYIVDAKSHIDAISKVKAVKTDKVRDSISQWNPGMSEIGLFQISYKRNGVYQSILVRANSEEQAKQKLLNNLNGVDIIGVNSHPSPHFHEPILDSNIKDINQVLLSNLEQVAQKGDAWRNKWKKLLDMTDKWNSYQWKELRNNDPKKYELIIRNKEYAEKEAEALNREWDRAIDALSRDRSFGRPGDYRMDLHSYKSRNDNYPMGNSQRYDEILYGYEQAEKSARAKKGLDSSIKDEWSGIRSNGVIFNYSNGKYTITHKNGKVETFPGNKFNTAEELFKYIDNIKDSSIKDSGINYGTLFIDLNSPNELTASRIVQELKNEIGNNKIAEIRGGSFTPVSEHSDGRLDLDFKEFKNNEWGTNHITLMVRSPLPLLIKTMKDDPKYGSYKLRAELNSKLKQFANKTIYSNKSFTMDSVIKDMPLMFKSNVNMQSLKSNIDNVKNKPNETYINSLNANIQGIIADIEEIKGYEKEGKFNESPALKFSCKNLTAQYYKLLNDPKLQGTLHKLDVPTYKNVLYAEHQAQMLSQVTLKDSAIKDYSPEVYINELKKLIPEYEKMRDLRTKIISYLTERNFTKYDDVERDARVKQYIKQVRELNNKWNRILENLDRFPIQQYKQESNTHSDRDIWFSGSPDQGTIRAIQRDIEAKNNK